MLSLLKAHLRCGCVRPRRAIPLNAENVNLSRRGNVIRTGRYDVHVWKDKGRVYDRHTNTWTEAWGDPHLKTSDGDKAKFHRKNLTMHLQDGSKLTIDVTPLQKNGTSWIDNVSVMKNGRAIEARGVHAGRIRYVHTTSGASDRRFADGTVVRAGHEVDDLHIVNGREVIGTANGG